jgi:hypothetical protein
MTILVRMTLIATLAIAALLALMSYNDVIRYLRMRSM